MTGHMFLSNEEYLQQQDIIRTRQQRIIQVREQSRKMAAAILNRMKAEAERQYQQTENRILSEIRQHYSRELASVRQYYHQCINDINQQHHVNHVNVINSYNEKRKQPLRILRNERNAVQESSKQVSKKPPESQIKETVSNKTAIDSVNTKKTTLSSSVTSQTNSQKSKKSVTKKVPHLPENIIVKSKETSIEFLRRDFKQSSSLSSQRRTVNVKKSVNFVNKENCHVDKPYIPTSPIKRYPAYARKPTFRNSQKTDMNEITEQQMLGDVLVEHDGNEIYNLLVHDRIRVLEQKEKILRRQSPSAPSVSNSILITKPSKFSEYFSNARVSVATMKRNVNNEPPVDNSSKKNSEELNIVSTDEISNDVDRVQQKKKLLFLELTNAETQTDQNVSSNSDSTSNGCDEEIIEQNAESEKVCVQSTRKSRSPGKIACLSPILKEKSLDTRIVKSNKPKGSENHHYKRKLLKSNGVTVTVSSNPTSVSTNGSDSTFSAPANSYPTTESSTESSIAHANHDHSHKTVQVVVNVLSSSESKERKPKSLDRQKNISYVIQENKFQKVPDWRKLFDNEEKMTESSYFSPPEALLKKQSKVNSVKFRSKAVKLASDEKSPDLGYYIQKLLLMRPESIENLDVSSSSTVTIDEVIQISNDKSEKKSCLKMPLYQNSLDDTNLVEKSSKLPYYQNSFDDTVDAVCEFVLKSQCNDALSNNICSADESIDLFTHGTNDQNSPSMSDASEFLAENFVPSPSISKRPENVSKSPQNSSDSGCTNILRSVERSQHETEDGHLKLPSMEELCKRGFVSEQLLNQHYTDEQETMEEEEFLQQLLTISQPKTNENKAKQLDFQSVSHDASKMNVSQKLTKDPVDEKDATAPNIDSKSKSSTSELKNENRLLGWMGTTVQRTLQASAINSTSSGDSSDPVRHAYQTLENLMEEPFDNSSENNSVFHKHFTLSPIKVPDIHLTISPVLKDGE